MWPIYVHRVLNSGNASSESNVSRYWIFAPDVLFPGFTVPFVGSDETEGTLIYHNIQKVPF